MAASRTNDLLEAILDELHYISGTPFLIVGDLNGELDDFPAIASHLADGTIVDVGSHAGAVGGQIAQPTCFATPTSEGTRRDYILSSADLLPYIHSMTIQRHPIIPVHCIIRLEIRMPIGQDTKRTLHQYPDLANIFHQHLRATHSIGDDDDIPRATLQNATLKLHQAIGEQITKRQNDMHHAATHHIPTNFGGLSPKLLLQGFGSTWKHRMTKQIAPYLNGIHIKI